MARAFSDGQTRGGSAARMVGKNMLKVWMPSMLYDFWTKEAVCFLGKQAFADFVGRNASFFSFAREALSLTGGDEHEKMLNYSEFFDVMRQYSFFEKWLPDRWVVLDEAVAHKMFAVLPWNEEGLAMVDRYCETMPPPDAVIYLEDTPESIVQKIQKRHETTSIIAVAHQGYTAQQLIQLNEFAVAMVDRCVAVLSEKNIPVLRLPAQNGIEENGEKAFRFIHECVTNDSECGTSAVEG